MGKELIKKYIIKQKKVGKRNEVNEDYAINISCKCDYIAKWL